MYCSFVSCYIKIDVRMHYTQRNTSVKKKKTFPPGVYDRPTSSTTKTVSHSLLLNIQKTAKIR